MSTSEETRPRFRMSSSWAGGDDGIPRRERQRGQNTSTHLCLSFPLCPLAPPAPAQHTQGFGNRELRLDSDLISAALSPKIWAPCSPCSAPAPPMVTCHPEVKFLQLIESSPACLEKLNSSCFFKKHTKGQWGVPPLPPRTLTHAPNPGETSLMNFQEIRAGTAGIHPQNHTSFGWEWVCALPSDKDFTFSGPGRGGKLGRSSWWLPD